MSYHKNGIVSMGTFVTNPMEACGEFVFRVEMLGKSEYGNKVSRHYSYYIHSKSRQTRESWLSDKIYLLSYCITIPDR